MTTLDPTRSGRQLDSLAWSSALKAIVKRDAWQRRSHRIDDGADGFLAPVAGDARWYSERDNVGLDARDEFAVECEDVDGGEVEQPAVAELGLSEVGNHDALALLGDAVEGELGVALEGFVLDLGVEGPLPCRLRRP